MGTGMIFEEGGQEMSPRGSTDFLRLPPPIFKFADPGYSVLDGKKHIVAHPNH